MNFKIWLELNDIAHRDISDIDLDQITYNGRSAYRDFEINNTAFQVQISKKFPMKFLGLKIDDVYDVSLIGPREYKTTNTFGGGAVAVYEELILTIRKLLETHPVNVLQLAPYEPKMRILYDKFYRNFMQKDFEKLEQDYFIKRSKLEEIKRKNPHLITDIQASVDQAHRDDAESIQYSLAKKQAARQAFRDKKLT